MREEVDNMQGRAERESQGVLRHIRGEGGGREIHGGGVNMEEK